MNRPTKNSLFLLAVTAVVNLGAGQMLAQEPAATEKIELLKPMIRSVWAVHDDEPDASVAPAKKYSLERDQLKVRVGNVGPKDTVSVKPPLTMLPSITHRGNEAILTLPPLDRGDHILVVTSKQADLSVESEEVRLTIGFPPAPRIEAISAAGVAPAPIVNGEVSISDGNEVEVSVAGVLNGDKVYVYLGDQLQKQEGEAQADDRPVTVKGIKPAKGKEYQVTATIVRGGDQSLKSKPVKLKFGPAAGGSASTTRRTSNVGRLARTTTIQPDYAFAHEPIVESLFTAEQATGIKPEAAAGAYDKGFDRLEKAPGKIAQYRFPKAARFPRTEFGLRGDPHEAPGLTIYEGMQLVFHESGRYEVRFATSDASMPVDLELNFTFNSRTLFTLPPIRLQPIEKERSAPRQLRHVGYSPVVQDLFARIENAEKYKIDSFGRFGSARFGYGFDFD